MIPLPLDDRYKIDLDKPILTLDVNQVAIRAPFELAPDYQPLVAIEWNYFETGRLEVAVTPETAFEITKGIPDAELGARAYERLEKSSWFKGRPSGSTLSLDEQQSNELWLSMRGHLWPTVSDAHLTGNQRADVSQLFFHAVSSGSSVLNSAFVTFDKNFLSKADLLRSQYGVTVMTPGKAWQKYQAPFQLIQPSLHDAQQMWSKQQSVMARVRSRMR